MSEEKKFESVTLPNGVTMDYEEITPELAKKYLEKNLKNRPIRKTIVDKYCRDLRAGDWSFTGDAIRFDSNGNLTDGQHRLRAIIETGISVTMLVFRNIDGICDLGKSKTVSDFLSIDGQISSTMVAAGVKGVMSLTESGGLLFMKSSLGINRTVSEKEALSFFEKDKAHYEKWIRFSREIYTKNKMLSKKEILSLLVYLTVYKGHSDEEVRGFFNQLADNEPACKAIRILRIKLSGSSNFNSRTLIPAARAAFITKAWNLYVTGKGDSCSEHKFKYRESSEKEALL